MNFWQAFSLASALLGWFARASADGKITVEELTEAVHTIVAQMGIDLEIEVPQPPAPPP